MKAIGGELVCASLHAQEEKVSEFQCLFVVSSEKNLRSF